MAIHVHHVQLHFLLARVANRHGHQRDPRELVVHFHHQRLLQPRFGAFAGHLDALSFRSQRSTRL